MKLTINNLDVEIKVTDKYDGSDMVAYLLGGIAVDLWEAVKNYEKAGYHATAEQCLKITNDISNALREQGYWSKS